MLHFTNHVLILLWYEYAFAVATHAGFNPPPWPSHGGGIVSAPVNPYHGLTQDTPNHHPSPAEDWTAQTEARVDLLARISSNFDAAKIYQLPRRRHITAREGTGI